MEFLFSENVPNSGEEAKKGSLSKLKVFLHSFQMNSGKSLNGYFKQVSC